MVNHRHVKRYGWRPSLPDPRDQYFQLGPPVALPDLIDLRAQMPLAPFDQGQLGSCVFNGGAGAIVFAQQHAGQPVQMPSRLYLYWFTRFFEGGMDQVSQDSGAQIRDAFKAANRWGDVPETDWPYDVGQFATRPPDALVQQGQKHKPLKYQRVLQTADQIRQVLAGGFPVIFGMSVFESFESQDVAQSGLVPIPTSSESMLGGHCMLIVGADATKQIPSALQPGAFLVRNSWGPAWGEGGHCWIPFEYLANPGMASDFWVLNLVC